MNGQRQSQPYNHLLMEAARLTRECFRRNNWGKAPATDVDGNNAVLELARSCLPAYLLTSHASRVFGEFYAECQREGCVVVVQWPFNGCTHVWSARQPSLY